MISRLVKFINISLILLSLNTKTYAGSVSDSMEDFWNNIGGSYSNSTKAGAYNLQGSGYYTAGSFVARNKVVNVNPVSIVPPGIRAGCGGIDFHTGSLSHIDTDQFIALLKTIPSNALGFSFQLALETLSPAIKGTVDQLTSIIDRINSINLNSCDMAQGLVGGGLALAGKSDAYCKTTVNSQNGWVNDFAQAANKCRSKAESSDYVNRANNVGGEQRPANINIAWEVLKKSKLITGSNYELAEFVMALTGTVIIKSPTSADKGPETIYKPNIATNPDTIKSLLEGGKLTIFECDEKDKCLNPTLKEITLATDKSFRRRISALMGEMTSRIASGESFETKHVDLINKTSIPIHKAMLVRQAYFGSSSAAGGINPEYYSSLVAIDVLYHYLDDILKTVQQQTKQVQNFNQENIEKFEENVRKIREELSKYKLDDFNSFEKGFKVVEQTMKVQSMLTSQMGSRLKNAATWARGIQ